MRWELYVSLALLFITSGATVKAQSAAEDDAGEDARSVTALGTSVVYYDINRNLTLNCSLSSADKTLTYFWKKNDIALDQVAELKGRYELTNDGATFSVKKRANEEDFGNYTCALGADERAWQVRGRPVVRLPDNTNVVEGQKLKLQCKVIGKPYATVTWSYKETEEDNKTKPLEAGAADGRVSLEPNEQGVPGAALVLADAARADAGFYMCHAAGEGLPPVSDHTQLRVKDMYAALWPFLGICAEVFVLCAIILVYEKRRTKPELDDSDTDNHDQKKS